MSKDDAEFVDVDARMAGLVRSFKPFYVVESGSCGAAVGSASCGAAIGSGVAGGSG